MTGTHRSLPRRLRLALTAGLGAGNFFWHAYRIAPAKARERALLHQYDRRGMQGWSLNRLRSTVIRYAAAYSERGVGHGTRVGVYTSDGLAGLLHHIAITSLGGVTVLANPRMAVDVVAKFMASAAPDLVIGDRELVFDGAGPRFGVPTVEVAGFDASARSTVTPPRHYHLPDDMVLISHSSGTTGTPKPTTFTHGSFFAGKRRRLWTFPSRVDDRLLSALPQSHSAGLSYVSLALMLGLPTLMMDDNAGRSPAEAMNDFLPTTVIGFPISLAELRTQDLSDRAATTVRTWMGMGDASHERHIRPLVAVGDRGSTYVDGLGSSEMGMVLFKTAYTVHSTHYDRAIGKPVPAVREAVVLDEDGTRLPDGQAGRLGVHAPSVTPGYVDDPTLDERWRVGKYLLTGDVVRRDTDGTFYHLDRIQDVITTSTGPVHSLPLEEVVLLSTNAFDAAVFAVRDPASPGHDRPAAVVLLTEPDLPPAEVLLAECNRALAEKDLPRLSALVLARDRVGLPVGVTGKVLKRELRRTHRDLLTRPADHSAVAGPVTR
ncbi:MAG: class I adenylate-forming enzyme family protein [Actinophytocola sp.]|uniref:class I adenylate-forming enzyme family protein n=1 Tax=Actinophytocola sp. TaxID=1872138 RepID=UPI003C72C4B7